MKPTPLMQSAENMRRALLKAAHEITVEQSLGVTKLSPESQRRADYALMVGSHAYRSPFKES
jgi:hypothetical protein